MIKVYILTGVPCSGKSTYIKSKEFKNMKIISFENYLTANIHENYSVAYVRYAKMSIKQKQTIFTIIENEFLDALKQKKDCVLDFTNLTRLARGKWFKLMRGFETHVTSLNFDVQQREVEKRNRMRENKTIPLSVMEQMFQEYETPSRKEGFNAVWHVAK